MGCLCRCWKDSHLPLVVIAKEEPCERCELLSLKGEKDVFNDDDQKRVLLDQRG